MTESQSTRDELQPIAIEREGDAAIVISWNDQSQTRWTVAELRKVCPCATCREKKRSASKEAAKPATMAMLPVLSAAEARPLQIESMRPVGSYAYSIAFSDGHSSGIFPFALLHDKEVS